MLPIRKRFAILLFLICFACVPIVSAESLWSDAATGNMFADHKAKAVGDILTIVINESSSAVRSGNASNSKSADAKMDAGAGIFHWIASASAGSSDSFQAKGALSNTNVIQAKMTVKVTEVKANGNLAITGTQVIKQNGEDQKITVTGLVRPENITADNTVLSSYVADAEIKIDGNGPIAQKQRQGILTRIFDFLF